MLNSIDKNGLSYKLRVSLARIKIDDMREHLTMLQEKALNLADHLESWGFDNEPALDVARAAVASRDKLPVLK